MYWIKINLLVYFQKYYFNNINLFLNFNLNVLFNYNLIFKKIISTNKNYEINKIYKNNFSLKFYKYFSLISLKNFNFSEKINLNLYYYSHYNFNTINTFNRLFFKNLINLVYNLTLDGKNIIFIDKNYKNILPLYNYLFSKKNLIIYKKYFFIDKSFFTLKNWIYFYLKFLNKFKINLVSVLNYSYFDKFFKYFKILNLPITSIIPINHQNSYIDYPVYFDNYQNNIQKFIFFNSLTQTFLLSYNFRMLKKKTNFLNLFYNFFIKNSKIK